jgi:hypothetical protein
VIYFFNGSTLVKISAYESWLSAHDAKAPAAFEVFEISAIFHYGE